MIIFLTLQKSIQIIDDQAIKRKYAVVEVSILR